MNTAIFRSGNVHNVISIDPYTIENTEIIFGPGSVVYGSDAIGGVMNFNTLSTQYSDNDQMFVKGSSMLRTSTAMTKKPDIFI
jgi:hemoglobin/transferrin/lactoferrin receptor protein